MNLSNYAGNLCKKLLSKGISKSQIAKILGVLRVP